MSGIQNAVICKSCGAIYFEEVSCDCLESTGFEKVLGISKRFMPQMRESGLFQLIDEVYCDDDYDDF